MTQKPHFFKLGLFVILSFCLIAAMLIALGAGEFFKKEYLAETCFNESVQGLDIGSEVKYKGVKIGTVKSISTPAKVYNVPSNYVLVTFSLSENCYVGQTGKDAGERMKKAIAQGLTVFLSFKGVTGAAYLETDYQGEPSPLEITWEPATLYVPSKRSNIREIGDTLNQIMNSLTQIDIQSITRDLAGLVKALNQKARALDMDGISTQTTALLEELRQTNGKISHFLGSDQMKQLLADAGSSFADFKTMIHQAKDPVGKTLESFQSTASSVSRMSGRLESALGPKLTTITTRMDDTLKHLESASKMLETMVHIHSAAMGSTIENLEYTSENLNQLILELKKYPGRILMEAPPATHTLEEIREKSNDTH